MTLKDGKQFGGFFGDKSYATTYPHDPELYLEEVWRVDGRGAFTEKVHGTLGTVVRLADCERFEFFNIHTPEAANVAREQSDK